MTEQTTRLLLRPQPSTVEYVDGGWWPRSMNLASELPALCAALSDQLGRVALVAYHLKTWNEAPKQLTLSGHAVRLEALTSKDPQTLAVIGIDRRCLTLQVIAPETAAATALHALQTASRPGAGDPAAGAERRTLADVATRLAKSERAADGQRAAEISRWVKEAAEQFDSAPIQAFVPILVEHIVRGRMAASSRATASGH